MTCNFKKYLTIYFLIILIVYQNKLNAKWLFESSSIGEGIPTYFAKTISNDKNHALYVEQSPDEYCMPIIFLKSYKKKFIYEKNHKNKSKKTIIKFSSSKKYNLSGYAASNQIYYIQIEKNVFKSLLIDFSYEKIFTIKIETSNGNFSKSFNLKNSVKTIKKASNNCIEIFLKNKNYILKDSNKRLLKKNEIIFFPDKILAFARNEIFARHGYIFQNEIYIKYFNTKKWYKPQTKKVKLSKIEEKNVKLIKFLEN